MKESLNILRVQQRQKLVLVLLMLTALISVLSSCSSVDMSEMSPRTVSLTVNISRQSPTIVTRAISDAIDNIDILIFDGQGHLIGSAYTSTSPTSVTLPTRFGSNCAICAVANTGSSSYLDGISTLTELRAKVTAPVSDPASALSIMYGETPNVTINASTATQSVLVKRIYSRYAFTITPSSDIAITDYQLCNVPNECFIAPGSSNNPTTGYSGINYSSVTTSASAGGVVTAGPYYVLENIAGKNSSITASEQRTSANAPSGASYILINAKRYAGWGAGWKSTYRIYLGGVTSATTPVVDCTDFNIYRGYDYNCNISIFGSGANDARVTYTALPSSGRSNFYTGDAIVGNYLYSDGTNGTTFKANQTVGIIYSSEITQAQYDAGCRHGRVLALKNANSGNGCYWSSTNNSPYTDHTSTGHLYATTFKTCFDDVSSGYDALNANPSYVNTSSNYAWYYCRTYNDGTSRTNVSPSTNTGWYLPSVGEWWDIMENLGTWTSDQYTTIKGMRTSTTAIPAYIIQSLPTSTYFDALNTKLSTAGGDKIIPSSGAYYFWSASENGGSYAVVVDFRSSDVYVYYYYKTNGNAYVRSVLAY
ncbi:DUF4906 domain-containing protein [Xylanibacter oryzae]|uniref:DUF4906 domain-containing protein n=1 Tax=Xylanibacter oryzae TaxID=185293 RepID=UPI0004B289EF|nr:DUF4906 domain-containing protein [Xylanibacter oryzae]